MSRSYLQPPGDFGDGSGNKRKQKAGRDLRAQLDFARYLQKRTADPSHIFRDHLRSIEGAVFYFLDLQSQYLTHLAPGATCIRAIPISIKRRAQDWGRV